MGQTIVEKIFSRKLDRRVRAGDSVVAPIDCAMTHESFAPSWLELTKAGVGKVWDPEKVVVVLDHYVPAPSERMAAAHKMIREVVQAQGIQGYFGEGEGVSHQVMMEKGRVRPGDLIVGADSHTTSYGALGAAATGIGTTEMAYVLARGELWFTIPRSVRFELQGQLGERVMSKDILLHIAGVFGSEAAQYRSIEFAGEASEALSVESRMTMSNMSVEIGAKFGFFNVDDTAREYLAGRLTGEIEAVAADADASYEAVHEIRVGSLEPQLACPHSVANVKAVRDLEGQVVHQAVLGSCTNGRYEDLEIAAEILKGRRVARFIRFYVYPASREVMLRAMERGILRALCDAGAILCNPSCGPCFGAHMGLLAPGEVCISTTNRNFRGRMGSAKAEVYLASPATVAASALRGAIADPREV